MNPARTTAALGSGLAGAAAVTALHQALRPRVAHPPRMDVYGRRAILRASRGMNVEPPKGQRLQHLALAGDIVANTLYYAAVGFARRRNAGKTGAALGGLAGIGAVLLPPVMRLGTKPSRRSGQTVVLTIAYYLLGGLVSALVYKALGRHRA
jgi:hypothetical protein